MTKVTEDSGCVACTLYRMEKKHLRSLLGEMDIPAHRRGLTETNVKWLQRNLAINNHNHPQIDEILTGLRHVAQTQNWDKE